MVSASTSLSERPSQQSLPARKAKAWHAFAIRNKKLVLGGMVILFITGVAVFADSLAVFGPAVLHPEVRLASPSPEHWFGTDQMGRDIYSRTVYGTRASLSVGMMVSLLATLVGTVCGLLGGFYKRVDIVLMRIMDGFMAFPGIVLSVGIMAAMGPQFANVVLALGVVQAPRVVRVVRSIVLSIQDMQYVEAARCIGVSDRRMLLRHILPNCISPLVIQSSFIFSDAVLGEAGLSFLGVGLPADMISWGMILGEARLYIRNAPWMMFLPGLALSATVLGLNLLGDGIRDWLDPRMRNRA